MNLHRLYLVAAGGSIVLIVGTNFVASDKTRASFGGAHNVISTVLSASTMLVVSPAVGVAGSVALEVTNNNQDYTVNAVPFVFDRTFCLCNRCPFGLGFALLSVL